MNKTIWIADDEQDILDYYRKILGPKVEYDFFTEGPPPQDAFQLRLFLDGSDLLKAFAEEHAAGKRVPLCILDMRMRILNGLDTATGLRKIDPSISIIFITAFSDYPTREIRQRLEENIYYMKKPFNEDELVALADSLVKSWNDRHLLLVQQKRLDGILNAAADGIISCAGDGTIEEWNLAAERIFFLSSGEMKGRKVVEVLSEESGQPLQILNSSGKPVSGNREAMARRKDGRLVPVEATIGSYSLEGTMYLSLVIRDISRRKALEATLRDSEQRWRFALESAGEAIWDWHPLTGQVSYSRQWKKMIGYAEPEIGNSRDEWSQRVHPDDLPDVLRKLEDHLEGRTESYLSEHRLRHKDGSYIWVLDRGQVLTRDADGKAARVIGTHFDITSRKAAEKALEEKRHQEESIASQIQQSLLFGSPPANLPGAHFAALSIPSQSVDGDFYDFYVHNDWCVDILVGDVMGKGVPAALIGAALKSSFLRALSGFRYSGNTASLPTPLALVEKVHSEVVPYLISIDSFVSLIYARFDLMDRRVDMINAGHPPPYRFSAVSQTAQQLKPGDVPMGFLHKVDYTQVSLPIKPGYSFLFFSDGLTDSIPDRGDDDARDIIVREILEDLDDTPETQLQKIKKILIAEHPDERMADDVTCVWVKTILPDNARALAQSTAVFTNRLEELDHMRDFIQRVYLDAGEEVLAAEDVPMLELAATEAMSNIIRHAFLEGEIAEIEVRMEIQPDRVSLTFSHNGREPFIHGDAPSEKSTGFGLLIISRAIDEAIYTHDDRGRKCIILVKKRH